MILFFLFAVIFIAAIKIVPFFKIDGISKWSLVYVFLLKIGMGMILTWIYTHYYTDRNAADIFKYFDDSKVLFSAFSKGHYSDYCKMMLGLSNDHPYLDNLYYSKMNHWYRHYDFGTYNDNHTIIRFNALVMMFSAGNFHVHTLFICFLSLIGLTALYKSFSPYLLGRKRILFAAIFLIPSTLFWGSGVLKEGILIFGIGIFFYAGFRFFIYRKNLIGSGLFFVFSILLIAINKNYLLFALIPVFLCFLISLLFFRQKVTIVYLTFFFSLFSIAASLPLLSENWNILKILALKQHDFVAVSKGGIFLQNDSYFLRLNPRDRFFLDTLNKKEFRIKYGCSFMYWHNENLNDTLYRKINIDTLSKYQLIWDIPVAGSILTFPSLQPSWSSFLCTIPKALYNSLCKPGVFSAKTIPEKVFAIENAVILLFLFACVLFRRISIDRNILFLCLFLSGSILFLIGFTTPVAGAIARYKAPILPFLVMAGLAVVDEQKAKNAVCRFSSYLRKKFYK